MREPTDPKSRAILKENKERLAYLDREAYLENGWPLAKLNINQLMDDETRTVGHWLLENALAKNDTYMVEYLVKVGANLLEQRDGEPPFLLQIFKRNQAFKLIILNHIIYHKTFRNKIEHNLQSYSDSKDIIERWKHRL